MEGLALMNGRHSVRLPMKIRRHRRIVEECSRGVARQCFGVAAPDEEHARRALRVLAAHCTCAPRSLSLLKTATDGSDRLLHRDRLVDEGTRHVDVADSDASTWGQQEEGAADCDVRVSDRRSDMSSQAHCHSVVTIVHSVSTSAHRHRGAGPMHMADCSEARGKDVTATAGCAPCTCTDA